VVFVAHAADPVRYTLVTYAGTLYVEIVITYIKVFVNYVNGLKLEKPLKHSNKHLKSRCYKSTYQ
jgi:hypothetical protein